MIARIAAMSPHKRNSLTIFRLNNKLAYKSAVPFVGFILVVAVSWVVLYPLLDHYYLYIFEPDVQTSIDLAFAILSGQAFWGSRNLILTRLILMRSFSFTRSDSWQRSFALH